MNERILVVDDEVTILDICKRALKRVGYEVVVASNVEQARGHFKEKKFDLLILDIHMPHEDGISFLKHVRSIDTALPTIIITGYPAVNTVINSIRLNVNEYLCKPFTMGQLVESVEAALKPDSK